MHSTLCMLIQCCLHGVWVLTKQMKIVSNFRKTEITCSQYLWHFNYINAEKTMCKRKPFVLRKLAYMKNIRNLLMFSTVSEQKLNLKNLLSTTLKQPFIPFNPLQECCRACNYIKLKILNLVMGYCNSRVYNLFS